MGDDHSIHYYLTNKHNSTQNCFIANCVHFKCCGSMNFKLTHFVVYGTVVNICAIFCNI